MRSQDVQLMKQLIAINTTINSMSSSRRPEFPVHRSASFSVINKAYPDTYQSRRCSDSACTTRKVLTRHNSEPVQTHSSSLNSSMEEIDSSYEDLAGSDSNDSDSESFTNSPPLAASNRRSVRKTSLYFMRPLPEEHDGLDEKKYHGILMKNIKLWKYSQESLDSAYSTGDWRYIITGAVWWRKKNHCRTLLHPEKEMVSAVISGWWAVRVVSLMQKVKLKCPCLIYHSIICLLAKAAALMAGETVHSLLT